MAERKGQQTSQRKSKLVEQMLAQQLSQAGAPAGSPLEVIGRLAMTYALNQQAEQGRASDASLRDTLIDQFLGPRPVADFGEEFQGMMSPVADEPATFAMGQQGMGGPAAMASPVPPVGMSPAQIQQAMASEQGYDQQRNLLRTLSQLNDDIVPNLFAAQAQQQFVTGPAQERQAALDRQRQLELEGLRQRNRLDVADVNAAARLGAAEIGASARAREGDLTRESRERIAADNRQAAREGRTTVFNYASEGPDGQPVIRAINELDGKLFEMDGTPIDVKDKGLLLGRPGAQSNPFDLLPKSQQAKFEDYQISAVDVLGLNKRLQQQVRNTPVGPAGAFVRVGDALNSQVRQLAQTGKDVIDGKEVEGGSLLDPSLFKTTFSTYFTGEAKKSAALQANIVAYAYLQLKILDPGGRVSDKDLEQSLRTFGASGIASWSQEQMIAALQEQEQILKLNYANRFKLTYPDRDYDDSWWDNFVYVPPAPANRPREAPPSTVNDNAINDIVDRYRTRP